MNPQAGPARVSRAAMNEATLRQLGAIGLAFPSPQSPALPASCDSAAVARSPGGQPLCSPGRGPVTTSPRHAVPGVPTAVLRRANEVLGGDIGGLVFCEPPAAGGQSDEPGKTADNGDSTALDDAIEKAVKGSEVERAEARMRIKKLVKRKRRWIRRVIAGTRDERKANPNGLLQDLIDDLAEWVDCCWRFQRLVASVSSELLDDEGAVISRTVDPGTVALNANRILKELGPCIPHLADDEEVGKSFDAWWDAIKRASGGGKDAADAAEEAAELMSGLVAGLEKKGFE